MTLSEARRLAAEISGDLNARLAELHLAIDRAGEAGDLEAVTREHLTTMADMLLDRAGKE